jgi:anti-sigma-K factor RskA
MSNEILDPCGCSERYAELCALSTSGELSADESAELQHHIAGCDACASLIREYRSLAQVGMTRLAAEFAVEEDSGHPFRDRRAEHRLVAALNDGSASERPGVQAANSWKSSRRIALLAAAATLLVSVGGAYKIGRRLEARSAKPAPVAIALPPVSNPTNDDADVLAKLAAAQKSLADTAAQSAEAEKQIAELTTAKTSLLAEIDQLTKADQSTSDSLAAVTGQRDSLQQQLTDTAKSLQQVRDDLNQARQERQGAVLRTASLEQEVNTLHATMASTDKAVSSDEQFLAKDRDIRELMGARELYIADVLDVEHNGERSKPFGRVFYTKGKSLIFYAFDLDSRPGYRETKAFQAWGRPDNASAKPISLGIFYMDNEKNSRWVVKSANADVLAQINAVFVTVEPKGGSEKPTGKPFLEAYLHTLPPNHP